MAGSLVEVRYMRSTPQSTDSLSIDVGSVEGPVRNGERSFADRAGGYVYEKTSRITRNRSIQWFYQNGELELREESLDFNFFNNTLRISIPGHTILPNVAIHETESEVVVCVATTLSIHRLQFPHPNAGKHGMFVPSGLDVSLPSIFNEAFNNTSHTQKNNKLLLKSPCHTFDCRLVDEDGTMCFALASETEGCVVLVKLPATGSEAEAEIVELKQSGVMQKLWAGVGSLFRSDSAGSAVESLSLLRFSTGEVYVLTLCRDLKLRVWSCTTLDLALCMDLTSLIPDDLTTQQSAALVDTISMHTSTSVDGQLLVAVHVNLSYQSQFIVLEAFCEHARVSLMHVSNFYSEMRSLQDMCVTSQYLWTLWRTDEDGASLCYVPIEGGKEYERGWHPVHFPRDVDADGDVFVPMFLDTKEAYFQQIFTPFKFAKEMILKAMQVYIRATDLADDFDVEDCADLSSIKEQVLRMMDLQVQQSALDLEVHQQEYQEMEKQCWAKFYEYLVQCRHSGERPLGLIPARESDSVAVLRRDFLSGTFELGWLEHLYTSDLDQLEAIESYLGSEIDIRDDSAARDTLILIECVKSIAPQFSADVITGIRCDMDGNENVRAFLESMASTLVSNFSEYEQLVGDSQERAYFLRNLEMRLSQLQQPSRAVDLIMRALDVDTFDTSFVEHASNDETTQGSGFLLSEHGSRLVSEYVSLASLARSNICRDFFVLLKLIETLSSKINVNMSDASNFGTTVATTCYSYLRSYHSIDWLARTSYTESSSSTMNSNMVNMAALDLTEGSPTGKVSSVSTRDHSSILYRFVQDIGLRAASGHVTETNLNRMRPGNYSTPEIVAILSRSVLRQAWPLDEAAPGGVPAYLVSKQQHSVLLEYLHLFDGWCSSNRASRDFQLARAYLGNAQQEKALKFFISAAKGINAQEQLFMNMFPASELPNEQLLVLYFIKAMRLFEQHGYSEMVVSTATLALTIAEKTNANIPMLWSVVFKHHLELRHHKEAYAAVTRNPDRTRRNDCLRHFIVTLCEREMFKEICEFPYIGLEDEVVSILETRARTMDITVNRYYDLLYAYHVYKGDYRRAATAMYEHSVRLKTEMHGLNSFQKQAKCLLASLSSLQLVEENYAWIVQPCEKISAVPNMLSSEKPNKSPKRKEDGEEVYHSGRGHLKSKNRTKIVQLADLEKEYLLVLARLKLIQHGKQAINILGAGITAKEIIGLLSQAGLFDVAFSVAQKFKIPMEGIFESLANKCAALSKSGKGDFLNADCWSWITLNETLTLQSVNKNSATAQAFNLLQAYLEKFNLRNSSIYLKPVARRLLNSGCSIPSWLVSKYKMNNPSELLRLYLMFDMVVEAAKMAVGYVDAVLGAGKEYYGLNTALHASTPPVWLPYTSLDQLLLVLRTHFEKPEMAELCESLQSKLEQYFSHLEAVSYEKRLTLDKIRVS